jgi:hypothetical protein
MTCYESLKIFSQDTVTMAEASEIMNKYKRYYALHREQKLSKYHNDPEVIAKREAREVKRAEKEAEKANKQVEKEKKRQEALQLALATKKPIKKSDGGLSEFLDEIPPVGKS